VFVCDLSTNSVDYLDCCACVCAVVVCVGVCALCVWRMLWVCLVCVCVCLCVVCGCEPSHVPGALAMRFNRDVAMQSHLHTEYSELIGHKAKEEFRLRWAETQLTRLTTRKTRAESMTAESTADGVYLPMKMLIKEEGDDSDGREAAATYARKCVALGGRWIRINPMTEREEFLYVKEGFKDSHKVTKTVEEEEYKEEDLLCEATVKKALAAPKAKAGGSSKGASSGGKSGQRALKVGEPAGASKEASDEAAEDGKCNRVCLRVCACASVQ
jgi:hypothetical protein